MIADADMNGLYDAMGVSVTFASPTITGKKGIFTAATDGTNAYGVDIDAQRPTLMIRTADITGMDAGTTTVTIDAVSYTVMKIERTGTGDSVLYLK